jgi:hypothetical protein
MVRQQDGTYAYHELPKALVDVLEDPSPERIRAYFEWKLGRTQKILRAAEAMKEYRSSLSSRESPEPPKVPSLPSPSASPAASPPLPQRSDRGVPAPEVGQGFTVKYFHRAGCHPCDTQDAVLAGWLRGKHGATLQVVEFGIQPDLWRRYNVRGTPSLVIEDQASGRTIFLEGLTQEQALDDALRRLMRPQGNPGPSNEGDRK